MDLKRLTTKKGKFSKAEQEWLVEEGARYGIEPPENTGCPDCWRDMAIRIHVAKNPPKGGRRLKDPRGYIFKGRVIAGDLDDETLAWLEKHNFPKNLLVDA